MHETSNFIDYLKSEQPRLWETISHAAAEGLIVIDEENDAVSATNRLLLTYPDLHNVLNLLVDNWVRKKTEDLTIGAAKIILVERLNNNG